MEPDDPLASMWQELRKYGVEDPTAKEEEQSLIRKLAAQGMTGLQYVGETLDKPGQALRGLLAGKPWELANLIPFSDALGITSSEGLLGKYGMNLTDDEDAVSGRDLLEGKNFLGHRFIDDNEEGLDLGDVLGFGVDVLTDPTTWIPGVGFTKIGKAFKKAGLAPDVAAQARRAGLDVAGAATARGKLTGQHLLDQALESGDTAAMDRLRLALGKGKEIAPMPTLEELAKPIGGLLNVGVPFVDSMQKTLKLPGLSNFLDTAYGGVRFGTAPMRALNTIFDKAHSTGRVGDSRYVQEYVVPNMRLHEAQNLNRINPGIMQYKGIAATQGDEIAEAYPEILMDEALYSAAEGTGPDVAGVFGLNKNLADITMDLRHRGALPEGPLEDQVAYAAQRKLQEEMSGQAGKSASADLKSGRQWPFRGASGAEQKAFFRSMSDNLDNATEEAAGLNPKEQVSALAELLRGDIKFRNPTGMSDEAYKAQRTLNRTMLPEVTGIDAPVHEFTLAEFVSGRPSNLGTKPTPAASSVPVENAQKQPWEMARAEFVKPVVLPQAKSGHIIVYHRLSDESHLENVLKEGLLSSRKRVGGEGPRGALWAASTPTGYSSSGTVVGVELPIANAVQAGTDQFIINRDVLPNEIVYVDRRSALGGGHGGSRVSDQRSSKYASNIHKTYVDYAIREGKPVPAAVLAEYPELQKAGAIPNAVAGGQFEFNELAAGIKQKGHSGIRKEAVDLSQIPHVYGPGTTGYSIVARDKGGKPLSLAVFANTEGGGSGLIGVAKDFEQGAKGSLASMKVFKKMLAEGLEIPIDSMSSDAAALLHHVYVDDAVRRGVEVSAEVLADYPKAGKSKALNSFLLNVSRSKKVALEKAVKAGSDLDRYEALARYGLAQSPEMLQAGVKMDPISAWQVVGNATAGQAARSFAFQDALKDKDLFKKYDLILDPKAGVTTTAKVQRELKVGSKVTFGQGGTTGKVVDLENNTALVKLLNPDTGVTEIVPFDVAELSTKSKKVKTTTPMQQGVMKASEAARQLGLDPQSFEFAPNVPSKFVEEMMPYTPEKTTPGGFMDFIRNITGVNKAWMTGAITNPSFPTRNVGSGQIANSYFGLSDPLEALRGIADFFTGGKLLKTAGTYLARGEDIPGIAADVGFQAQAKIAGRVFDPADDKGATNFVRELIAAHSDDYGGKHTPDMLAANQMGVGDFIGGMAGPKGPEAYSSRKVLGQAAKTWDQVRGRDGGWKALAFGAPGVAGRKEATSAPLIAGATLNNYAETLNRANPWLSQFLKGTDPAEAMRQVNRAQINYSPKNFTDVENRYLTQLIPFYKFLKSSGVAHLDELANNPGGPLSQLLQGTSQIHDTSEVLPEHITENLAIPVDKLPEWTGIPQLLKSNEPDTRRYLTGLGMMYEPLTQLIAGGDRGDLPFLNKSSAFESLGTLNPIIKALGELTSERSFFRKDSAGGGQLMEDLDPLLGRIVNNAREYLTGVKTDDPHLGMPGEGVADAILLNSPLSRLLSSIRGLSDTREGGLKKGLSNFVLGPKLTDVNRREILGEIMNLAKQDINQKIPQAKMFSDVYVPKSRRGGLSQDQLEVLKRNQLIKKLTSREMRKPDSVVDPLDQLTSGLLGF